MQSPLPLDITDIYDIIDIMLHRFQLRTPKPLMEKLNELAHYRRTSTNQLIVEILEEYIVDNAIETQLQIHERKQR
jgi:hypothetical protein